MKKKEVSYHGKSGFDERIAGSSKEERKYTAWRT